MCNEALADQHLDKGDGSRWAKRRAHIDLLDARMILGPNYTARRLLLFQNHVLLACALRFSQFMMSSARVVEFNKGMTSLVQSLSRPERKGILGTRP